MTTANNTHSEPEGIAGFEIKETDNYITAIIGGRSKDEDGVDKKEFTSFLEMLAEARLDPSLKEQLLDTLKSSPSAAAFLVETIDSPAYGAFRSDLLAMCWEAGLDMTVHLDYFINLAASSDEPLILLEVQTIVQEMNLEDKVKRDAALHTLQTSLKRKANLVSKEIINDLIEYMRSRE